MWLAYIHSYSEESYPDYKSRVFGKGSSAGAAAAKNTDEDLDEDGMNAILNGLFHEERRDE